jgi:hypothetical protein
MLKFDKFSHCYKNIHTEQEYTSATTFISKFKKKFDADFHAKRVAEKEGVTPEEIKERWKKINSESKVRGSNIHSAIDDYNKTGDIDTEYKEVIESLESLKLYDRKNSKCEELVYNHNYKLAGTADCIEDCGSTFNVYDFKTNKKFNLYSQYKSFFLDPISHLSECEYNTYSLQLSLYAFMYQSMTGKNVGKLGILHLDADNKFTVFYSPYLLSDINKMLNYA